ncbi:MAG: DUF4279 domain-containing protein [Clostridia bacterium]|nr:DUF4279 domain-containing protein [Clostridia bacterium]
MFKRKRDDKCYTYFSIRGDFDTDVVTSLLGLQPYKTWKSTDTRKDGKPHGFSCWDYGKCEEYDILTENQMLKTIADLIPKIDILKQIREKYDVEYYLEIVPEIYSYNSHPCLAPSLAVIDFCYETRTNIDIDLYVID